MATPNRIRSLITAQPFRPFTINLVGGKTFTVRHPEYAAMSPDGREMIVYDDEGKYYAETLMIDLIEEVVPTPQSGPDGDGA